jgi:hypothetical protein
MGSLLVTGRVFSTSEHPAPCGAIVSYLFTVIAGKYPYVIFRQATTVCSTSNSSLTVTLSFDDSDAIYTVDEASLNELKSNIIV